MRFKVEYYAFLGFKFLVMLLPAFLRTKLFNTLAYLVYLVDKKHNKIVHTNLNLCFGNTLSKTEVNTITKESYKTLFLNILSLLESFSTKPEALKGRVKITNEHYIKEALEKKEKIIFVTAHSGIWEIAGSYISSHIIPTTTVFKRLNNPYLNAYLVKSRQKLQMHMTEKDGAARHMLKALLKGHAVEVLVDQNTSNEDGILIDFFGKKARQTPAPSFLSRKLNATIIVGLIKRTSDRTCEVIIHEPFKCEKTDNEEADILACTQKQATLLEIFIRDNLTQWFWLHKRWKNQYEEIYK